MKAPLLDNLHAALEWMDAHLDDGITAADGARKANLSLYHFNRVFKSVTGMAPGLYLRRRRLTRAAEKLVKGEGSLIDCALDAGYDSQEAFTRAFKDMFGITPGQAREGQTDLEPTYQVPLTKYDLEHFSDGGLTMEPEFREREAFTVSGLAREFEYDQLWDINAMWKEFLTDFDARGLRADVMYGVACGTLIDGKINKTLTYMAGYEADGEALEGMSAINIPANRYAVFTHNGHVSAVDATLRYIWQIWVPRSGMILADGPDFERYDESFNEATQDGTIEFWVPIRQTV